MIMFIALVIAGVVSFTINIITYCKRGGISSYWLDLIERYESACPIIKFNGGVD